MLQVPTMVRRIRRMHMLHNDHMAPFGDHAHEHIKATSGSVSDVRCCAMHHHPHPLCGAEDKQTNQLLDEANSALIG